MKFSLNHYYKDTCITSKWVKNQRHFSHFSTKSTTRAANHDNEIPTTLKSKYSLSLLTVKIIILSHRKCIKKLTITYIVITIHDNPYFNLSSLSDIINAHAIMTLYQ